MIKNNKGNNNPVTVTTVKKEYQQAQSEDPITFEVPGLEPNTEYKLLIIEFRRPREGSNVMHSKEDVVTLKEFKTDSIDEIGVWQEKILERLDYIVSRV